MIKLVITYRKDLILLERQGRICILCQLGIILDDIEILLITVHILFSLFFIVFIFVKNIHLKLHSSLKYVFLVAGVGLEPTTPRL